jgi:hypothetical protein
MSEPWGAEIDPFVPALKLKIEGEATFDLEAGPPGIKGGPHSRTVTVTTARVVLGRGPSATLPMVGDPARKLSRAHLVFNALGGIWTFADLGSTNGTQQQVSGSGGRPVWTPVLRVPRPVDDVEGTVLLLANAVILVVTLELRHRLEGKTTAKGDRTAGFHRDYIEDPKLEEAASAVLRHRRENRSVRGGAGLDELGEWLGIRRRTVQDRLNKLRDLEPIRGRWRREPDNLADLLEEAYPYLMLPRDDEPPSGESAGTVTSAGD